MRYLRGMYLVLDIASFYQNSWADLFWVISYLYISKNRNHRKVAMKGF